VSAQHVFASLEREARDGEASEVSAQHVFASLEREARCGEARRSAKHEFGGIIMRYSFFELMEANPVIAAIKDEKGLENCCACEEIRVVFILYGDICTIGAIVERVKAAGKIAMVHMDLIDGLKGKESTVDFIKQFTAADGIISTKTNLIKRAKELGLYTVLRFFILDSMAYENIQKQLGVVRPDALEILPGLMPKIIRRVSKLTRVPVIAGGLIAEKEDVMAALGADAISVSTTNPEIWRL
jgi:glycerol uptake operon antiterminator